VPLPEYLRLVAPVEGLPGDPTRGDERPPPGLPDDAIVAWPEPVRSGRGAAGRPAGAGRGGGAMVAEAEPVELTAREREVLSCLAEGMSNKQVAQSLGISIRTVTVHVSNLLRKTRSASRTEAAVWALQRR